MKENNPKWKCTKPIDGFESKEFKERNDIKTPMIYMEQSAFQSLFGNIEFKQ